MTDVSKTHPRYFSLRTRDLIVGGVEKGITSIHGLIAHGRGEAFDYIFSEKTNDFALKAIESSAAMLILAESPVISVNGNAAALCAKELSELSLAVKSKVEVNIFHTSKEREEKIKNHLLENGAKEVLMPDTEYLKDIGHNRRFVNMDGIGKSDLVLVPLEDGDRCEALINSGKKVITIDLNPMSRTAKTASVTIVDNILRAVPLITKKVMELKNKSREELEAIVSSYDNNKILKDAANSIKLR